MKQMNIQRIVTRSNGLAAENKHNNRNDNNNNNMIKEPFRFLLYAV